MDIPIPRVSGWERWISTKLLNSYSCGFPYTYPRVIKSAIILFLNELLTLNMFDISEKLLNFAFRTVTLLIINVMGKKMSMLISLAFAFVSLFTFVGCSSDDDDIPTTGFVRVEFPYWSGSVGTGDVYVYLADQYASGKYVCIKSSKLRSTKTTDIELNPGNYYVRISMDGIDTEGDGYLQVQAGKVEVIKVKIR